MPTYRELFQQLESELAQSQEVLGQGPWEQFLAKARGTVEKVAQLPGKAIMGSDFEKILEKSPQGGQLISKVPQTTGEKIGAFAGEVVPELVGEAAFIAGTGGVGAVPLGIQAVGSGLVGGIGGGVASGPSGAAIGAGLGFGLPLGLDKLINRVGRKGVEALAKLSDDDLARITERMTSWQQQVIEQTGRAPTEDEIAEAMLKESGRQMNIRGVEPPGFDPVAGRLHPSPEVRQLFNIAEGKTPAQLPPGNVSFSTVYNSAGTGSTPSFRKAAAMTGASQEDVDLAVKILTASKRDVKGRFTQNVKPWQRGLRYKQWLDEVLGGTPASDIPNVDVAASAINNALQNPIVSKSVRDFIQEGVEKAPGQLDVVADRVARRRPFVKFKGAGQQTHIPGLMLQADTFLTKAFTAAGIPPKFRKAMTGLAPPIEGVPVLTPTERIVLGQQYKISEDMAVNRLKSMAKGVADDPVNEGEGVFRRTMDKAVPQKAQAAPDETIEKAVRDSAADHSPTTGEEGFLLIGRIAPHLPPGSKEAVQEYMKRTQKYKANVVTGFYNAMLLWPKTILRNLIGNTLEMGTGVLERGTRAALSGDPGQMAAQFKGLGLTEAWANAGEAWRTGMIKAIREGGDEMGEVLTTPWARMGPASKILSWMDDFYTTIAYHSDLSDRIYRTAAKTGKKGKALTDEVMRLRENVPEELAEKSMGQARRVVFRDVANGNLQQGMDGFFRGLHSNLPVIGRMIAPFGPTLTRIGKRGLEWSPFGYVNELSKAYRRGVLGQDIVGEDAVLSMIRATYGTVAMGGLSTYAMNGYLTGGLDHLSEGEKTTQRSAGEIAPYSFKVGDNWYSYRNLGPVTMLLGTVANTMEDYKKNGNLEASVKKIPLEHLSQAMNATYLPGVMDIARAIMEPDRYSEKAIDQLFRFIQPVSAVAGIARAVDPTVRDTDVKIEDISGSLSRTLSSRLPGESETAGKPKLGLFGEELKSTATPEATGGERVELVLSPFNRKKLVNDPVIREVARVNAPLTAPSMDLKIEALTEDDRWTASKAMGMLQRKLVAKTVGARGYADVPDDEKSKALQSAHNKARRIINKRVRYLATKGKEITYRALLKGLIAE